MFNREQDERIVVALEVIAAALARLPETPQVTKREPPPDNSWLEFGKP